MLNVGGLKNLLFERSGNYLSVATSALLASCAGMFHDFHTKGELPPPLPGLTQASFSLTTFSDFDSPEANWSLDATDEYFSHFECLTEELSQATGEVVASGVWEDCTSPYDLTQAPGVDVEEGFNGQLLVRAVSKDGEPGLELAKPFRRALWFKGFNGRVEALAGESINGLFVGGDFTGAYNEHYLLQGRIARLNTDGSTDLSPRNFLSGFDADVFAVAVQSDGKILLGGGFASYNGSAVPFGLIRLHADGSVDSSFNGITTGFNAAVNSIVLQSDGKILVGGSFTAFNGSAGAPDGVIRLNADGSVDSSFNGITTGVDGSVVRRLALQSDGKILVGGEFTSFNGSAGAPDRLIRLNSNGSVDAGFTGVTTGFNDVIRSITLQSDGKILVSGAFTTFNGAGSPLRFMRLNTDGSADASFTGLTTGFDASLFYTAVQGEGKILVAGGFTSYNGDGGAPDRLLRLNSDGSVDSTFSGISSGFNAAVRHCIVQSDGKILVGGDFTSFNGDASAPDYLVRLNANGSLDTSFSGLKTGFNDSVWETVVQSNGNILAVGEFQSINSSPSGAARIAKLDQFGQIDADFSGPTTGFDFTVFAMTTLSNGSLLAGGLFTSYNGDAGAPDRFIALNSTGVIDTSFSGLTSGVNSTLFSLVPQSDGKILVGGLFASYNGNASAPDRLMRLNTDGTLDSAFNGITSGFNVSVISVALQQDGKILVGGDFTSYNGSAGAPDRLIRLNANGSVDSTFTGLTSGLDATVETIVVQTDGKILLGGNFTTYNGGAAPDSLLRLNSDGTLDSSFSGVTTGMNGVVEAIAVQSDGKILVGGGFTSFNGNASAPDYIIRLNADGSIDSTFNGLSTGLNGAVEAIIVQSDGKILVGGDFTAYNGDAVAPDRVIRLNSDGTIDEGFLGQEN